MSYNRSTQAPCSPNCCSPATFTTTATTWLQDYDGTVYNITATQGVYSNSVTVSADDLVFMMPTECCPIVTCDSSSMSMSVSGTATPSSDSSINQTPTYATTCQLAENCDDPPCSDYPYDWGCSSDSPEEYATKCISTSAFGHDACFPDDPLGYDDCAILTMGGDKDLIQGSSLVIDTDWYSSGVYIYGTPSTFVGYPSELDACGSERKGLRKIYAKLLGSQLHIRWFVMKEWDTDAPENIVYYDYMTLDTNQLGELLDGIQANKDVGVQAYGSGGYNTLWRTLRLGDGTGDGSFGDGSGWYDITEKFVQFYYQEPNQYRLSCTLRIDYGGEHCGYCCDDSCTCPYTDWTWVSDYAQILYSSQVEDSLGNQTWDAGAGGVNFGGDWTLSSTSTYCKTGATLSVS